MAGDCAGGGLEAGVEDDGREVANFDLIARPYRFLEYLALGSLLQRVRTHFLARLQDRREALLLGDGDGRFLAALLKENRSISIHAVDTSGLMLALLRRRAAARGPGVEFGGRVCTHRQDARTYLPDFPPDLIVTHFFFDCLRQKEVNELVQRLATKMTPDGMWVVSEFRIPDGRMRMLARIYVRLLYFAFRILTGLRVTRLPDHAPAFARMGMTRVGCRRRLFGLLTSELWQKGM